MKTLLFILLLIPVISFSQKQADNWYFGDFAGVNFATGNPVSLTGGMTNTVEGVATISDVNGNLLFYTDGITVWNKNHQTMQNGFGLFGHPSSTASAIIVPQPNNDSIYYIFTTTAYGMINGVRYSIVNMNAAGGLGAIIQKNIPLTTPVCEKTTAVNHCNNRDIWVVSRQFNGNNYFAWLVTPAGVSSTPVVSVTSNYIGNSFYTGSDAIGYLKISPDGTKIAAAHNYSTFCELGKFNNSTGIVSDVLKISSIPPVPALFAALKVDTQPYGVEFSPDNKLLYLDLGERVYLTNTTTITYDMTTLNQYNISIHDSASIAQSHYFVDSASYTSVNDLENALQLAPNLKIYKTHYPINKLSVVNNPNVQGIGCSYQVDAVSLVSGASQIGLPSFVASFFSMLDFTVSGSCSSLTKQFQVDNLNNVDSVKWNFDDPGSGANNTSILINPTHIFTLSGNFTVKLYTYSTNGCGNFIDSCIKTISVGTAIINLGNDTTICSRDTITLTSNIAGGINLWSTSSTNTSINVTQPGVYWVRVNFNSCVATDTISISNYNIPQFSIGKDTLICNNVPLVLSPFPNIMNANYLWSTNETTHTISVTTANNYWLQMTNSNGCKWRDTINVSFKQLPNYNLGNDTSICQKDTIVLNATVSGASSYLWSNTQTTPILKAFQSDTYWCDVTKDGCTYRDSIDIIVKPLPAINFSADTTLCETKTLLLDATNPSASYLWQDGSNNSTYLVNKAGRYSVTVNTGGCKNSKAINVLYTLKPKFTLGIDRQICEGELISLQPVLNSSWQLLWQDGNTDATYNVSQPGTYILQASNTCGFTKDTVIILKGLCKVYIPKAFTPNGDAFNNTFRALGVENVASFSLKIYNRYGQMVFNTTDKYIGWDGKFGNQQSELGAYTYFIQYTDRNSLDIKTLKGTLLLIR